MTKMRNIFYTMMCLLLAGVAVACNSSNSDDDEIVYDTSGSTTMVNAFSLGSNDKVLYNLDSVFFTIDQERALIYNADSLPVGTNVTKLTVSLTLNETVSSAEFIVKGGTVQSDTTISYSSTTTDSIDFTGNVTVKITSLNGNYVRNYNVKVNVHQTEPDSLHWNQAARRDIPNVTGTLHGSKMVQMGDTFHMLTNDATGWVMSTAANPGQGTWSRSQMAFPFTPQLSTFTATTDALYILDNNGELYTSTNGGGTWTDCGVAWTNIYGAWEGKLLGVKNMGGAYWHDEFPKADNFVSTQLTDSFPVNGASNLAKANNSWTPAQQVMMAGGVNKQGNRLSTVWGYDGTRWGQINGHGTSRLPAISQAVLVPYVTHNVDTVNFSVTQSVTWLLFAGSLSSGTMNTTTYQSQDQGITWTKAATSMQLPSYIPACNGASVALVNETLTASSASRRATGVTQPITQWSVPYIYLAGGYAGNGTALQSIWKGAINRLTFKPMH